MLFQVQPLVQECLLLPRSLKIEMVEPLHTFLTFLKVNYCPLTASSLLLAKRVIILVIIWLDFLLNVHQLLRFSWLNLFQTLDLNPTPFWKTSLIALAWIVFQEEFDHLFMSFINFPNFDFDWELSLVWTKFL